LQVASGSVLVWSDSPSADSSPMTIIHSLGEAASVRFSNGATIQNQAQPLLLNQPYALYNTSNQVWSLSLDGSVIQKGYLYSQSAAAGPKWWLNGPGYSWMAIDTSADPVGQATLGIGHSASFGGTVTDDVTVTENGDLSVRGKVIFGGTNAPTSGTNAPAAWVPVQIQGDPTVYHLPVYR